MREASLDPIRIAASLGAGRGRDARRVEGGSDTLLWRVELPDGPVAVRLFRSDQGAAAEREAEALAAAHAGGVPVPAVIARGTWEGRPVTVIGWCTGETVVARLLEAPDRAEAIGLSFGRTQAAIHRVAAPAGWRADGWRGWVPAAVLPAPDEAAPRALLHLDFHPMNVLVEGETVTAVLDWVNARAGDPRADVARTYSILVADPGVGTFDRRVVRAFRRGWRAGYEELNGPLRDLAPFVSWAGRVMAHDLQHRLSDAQLDRIIAWTAGWDRRALRRGDTVPDGPVAQR